MQPFNPQSTVSLAVTTTTGRVALPGITVGPLGVRIHNAGPATVFIKFGTVAVTAATTDTPVPAGVVEIMQFNDPAETTRYVAGITSAGAATVYFTVGGGI